MDFVLNQDQINKLQRNINRLPYLCSTLRLKDIFRSKIKKGLTSDYFVEDIPKFLSDLPLRANYSYEESFFGNTVEEIFDIAQRTDLSIKDHLLVKGLTNRCTLWLDKEQYENVRNFILYD